MFHCSLCYLPRRRGDVSEDAFDEQVANIAASREAVDNLFRDRIITAIKADGTRAPCEENLRRKY
jgi:hypothetical protein